MYQQHQIQVDSNENSLLNSSDHFLTNQEHSTMKLNNQVTTTNGKLSIAWILYLIFYVSYNKIISL